MTRLAAPFVLAVLLAGLLAGCSGSDDDPRSRVAERVRSSVADRDPDPGRRPCPGPKNGACYRLAYDEAVAPTSQPQARAPATGSTPRPRSTSAPSTRSTTATCSPSTPGRSRSGVATECPDRLRRLRRRHARGAAG